MSDVEAALREAAQPHLRPTEQINGCGAMSRVVPIAGRLIPLASALYTAHYLVVATNERLLVFATSYGFLGGVNPPSGAPDALELSEVLSVERFNPVIIGHDAIRLTTHTGLVHELMFKSSVSGLAAHTTFAAQFPGWLIPQVSARAFQPPSAERTLGSLTPRPAVGTWYLLISGGLMLVAFVVLGLAMIASGFTRDILTVVPLLFYGSLALGGGIYLRRKRARQLGQTIQPIGATLQQNRGLLVPAGIVFGGLLVLCLVASGFVFAYDAWENAQSEARFAEQTAASDAEYERHRAELIRFPARDAYPPATTPTGAPSTVTVLPTLEVATARLTAVDFHVTPAAPTAYPLPNLLWDLHAVGDGGQSMDVSGYGPGAPSLPFDRTCVTGPAGSLCYHVILTRERYATETYLYDAYAGWGRWLVSTLLAP